MTEYEVCKNCNQKTHAEDMSEYKKTFYKVSDLTDFSVYRVNSAKEGKDSTDRSAIKICEEMGDVITMGKVVVEPITHSMRQCEGCCEAAADHNDYDDPHGKDWQ